MDHPLGHVGRAVFGSKAPARGRGVAGPPEGSLRP